MSLIYCSECGGVVSEKAEKCPHCGAPVENPNKKWYQKNSDTNMGIMFAAIAFFLVCLCVAMVLL